MGVNYCFYTVNYALCRPTFVNFHREIGGHGTVEGSVTTLSCFPPVLYKNTPLSPFCEIIAGDQTNSASHYEKRYYYKVSKTCYSIVSVQLLDG